MSDRDYTCGVVLCAVVLHVVVERELRHFQRLVDVDRRLQPPVNQRLHRVANYSGRKVHAHTHTDEISAMHDVHIALVVGDEPFLLSCIGFYRAMHYNAKRGLEIACRLSVRLFLTLVDHDHIG